MTRADWISIAALAVSIGSFCFSVYLSLRDRARLVVKSKFVSGWDPGTEHIVLTIVNAGRRPIIVRLWGGVGQSGEWVGTYLSKETGGLRLAEHELHEITITKDDLYASTPDDEIAVKDLWIEDSLGRRYQAKDASKHISELRKLFTKRDEEKKRLLLLIK